jgi:adenylate cyclase
LYHYIPKPEHYRYLILTVSKTIESDFKENQVAEKNQELERKATTFHKFVPVQFLKLLNIEEYDKIKLGDCVEKNMTIMFADILGFTTLSQPMTPQNFNFINEYLSQMEPIIDKYNGFIDKNLGDGIMALFPTSANDAVQAAISMLKKLIDYNQGRQRAGYQPINIGIGIHTGPLMLGTVGGQNSMDGTVISEAVGLASRVEDLTITYRIPLLITEQILKQLTDAKQYKIKVIDHVTIRGRAKAVTVYEVFDADSPPSTVSMFY